MRASLLRALCISGIVAMIATGAAAARTSPTESEPAMTFDTPAPDSSPAAADAEVGAAASEASPDPVDLLADSPGIVELSVGLPNAVDRVSPVTHALEAGYFDEVGFTSVEIVDVDEPLLGLLRGEIEFGVMDTVDVAEAVAQGLPLVALAGHQNYLTDGSYGGDVLVGSSDVLADEGPTVAAFLSAYVQALGDLVEEPTLAPHDGGFGSLAEGDGLGELDAFVASTMDDLDVLTLVRPALLNDAQVSLGLEPNPPTEDGAAE